MARVVCLTLLGLWLSPGLASPADPKSEELLGKWELLEAAEGIPKGWTYDFQKEGKLIVSGVVNGKQVALDLKYELKPADKTLVLVIGAKTDTVKIVELDRAHLLCRANDGTTAKFKRVK